MIHSIQDYLKRINSEISMLDILGIFVTLIIILIFTIFLKEKVQKNDIPVSYTRNKENYINQKAKNNKLDSRPFASTKGKTYTFSWCKGNSNISSKNKIYFSNEEEAKATGRTLSKLCQN